MKSPDEKYRFDPELTKITLHYLHEAELAHFEARLAMAPTILPPIRKHAVQKLPDGNFKHTLEF